MGREWSEKKALTLKPGLSADPTLVHSSLELLVAMPEHVRTRVGREGALTGLIGGKGFPS